MAMANSIPGSKIELSLTVTLTEAEIRAFDALAGYGTDGFLKVFYEHMGTSYMKPHEQGLRDLFKTLRPQCQDAIDRINAARKAFQHDKYEVRERKTP
jgi:hypothetical protein